MLTRPPNQQAQEDAVLGSLLARMADSGLDAMLLENPDRLARAVRRIPELTSDGLVEVSEVGMWSVDVMTVVTSVDLYRVPEMLEDRLLPLAEQFGVVVSLSGVLPAQSAVDAVVAAVHVAMKSEAVGSWKPAPRFTVEWVPVGAGKSPTVQVMASLGESPLLSNQVEAAIRKSLTRKAMVQARPARLAGCGTAVALDQVGHMGIKAGTQWLPQHPSTFRVAVDSVLADLPEHFLDSVLLHDQNDGWHVLIGDFPGLSSDD